MSRAAALAAGRAAALAGMTDAVIIRAPDSFGPKDPATGKRPVVAGAIRYEGAAKVQSYEAYSAAASSGAHMYTVQNHRVDIPVGAGPVFAEDIVTVTASELNPHLVGDRSTVAGVPAKSQTTAQRLQCQMIAA